MGKHSRNALLTGASKGVGRGVAVGLAKDGWNVAVNYCSDEAGAEETAKNIRDLRRKVWLLQADIGFSDQVQSMFEQFTKLTSLLKLVRCCKRILSGHSARKILSLTLVQISRRVTILTPFRICDSGGAPRCCVRETMAELCR